MELSKRLKRIAEHVDKCESVADIGTDHGYIPIYLVKEGICKKAIASDINKGPIEKAKVNVAFEGVSNKVKCLLGPGLNPLKVGEVNGVILAGMGGNLTRDILLADMDKVKKYDFIILQPAQNPEVLREFLYKNDYEIIDEDLIKDEGRFYELFKVKYNENSEKLVFEDELEYEVSPLLREKGHPLFKKFIEEKINRCETILSFIKEDTEAAKKRKSDLEEKINKLKGML
ncbi:tRNA (adenine(22)-N(1))-methyltransferase [Clostridium perfringens]|uniref:tRNA (adenine(22)-N(1))-methyltransferase n=1 Tax=Clostridium perfringens TaxID=1502 RepID=UPI000E187A83|nr:class I SAM-dependent methyltransferase [Clostridium perfringens]MBP2861912.1 SAM-dependent methyltransferase [Clostridium perfringens]MDH5060228.1 tRNA (adenine(22)-N(1))-methyltransferase [Clostridium perfringens NCTC 8239]CAG9349723.1 tRNA (adenine(22)-N(1))-methyltransferase TrmK [Clostridium perfringens NCTC 8239]SUY24153.1 tRNA (adenine(22)-N(1))-methyltransferase TrmK [Clostridium perfringens]HBI6982124.1 SAM-dependent methyltransferase [Clostridium perfringens]